MLLSAVEVILVIDGYLPEEHWINMLEVEQKINSDMWSVHLDCVVIGADWEGIKLPRHDTIWQALAKLPVRAYCRLTQLFQHNQYFQ